MVSPANVQQRMVLLAGLAGILILVLAGPWPRIISAREDSQRPTPVPSGAATLTPTVTPAHPSPTAASHRTVRATRTPRPSRVPTVVISPSDTFTPTPTSEATVATPTMGATLTPTDLATVAATPLVTPAATETVTPAGTSTLTGTATSTVTETATPTATETATAIIAGLPIIAPQIMAAPVALLAPTPSSPIHADGAGYSPTTDSCSKCHRTHSASDARLLRGATSEATCYTCHNGTGAPSVLAQFGRASIHPINTSPEIHRPGESSPADFSGSRRHVECVDCHDAHQGAGGNHTRGSSFAAGTSQGVWGIDAANGAAWTTPIFSVAPQVATEAQLCFKCHSAWAYGGSPPTSHTGGIVETDQALEFNVNNVSYHWVEGDQTASSGVTPRTNDGRNMAFVAGSGWTKTSNMACTDCHASENDTDPRGPHGSTQAYLLRGTWATNTGKAGTSGALCFKCHDWNTYGQGGNGNGTNTGFSNGTSNYHTKHLGFSQVIGCQSCHSAVPHGGQYRAMLAPRSVNGTPVPITDYNRNSRLTINNFRASGAWLQKSDCSGCH